MSNADPKDRHADVHEASWPHLVIGSIMGSPKRRPPGEAGVALMTAMIMTLLTSTLLVGFTFTVMSDHNVRAVDRERTKVFYAAHAGLEKLTTDLGNLFAANYRPSAAQLQALTTRPPVLPYVDYNGTQAEPGYAIDFPTDLNGDPDTEVRTITTGPFQGFVGLVTPYTLASTAHTGSGGEARLVRTIQTVGIPAFQFGIFSENSLSFHAGPSFDFGGRVHSNENIFFAQGNNSTLTMADRVTVVGEVIRTHLANGVSTSNRNGDVDILVTPGVYRDLERDEGSLVGTLGSAENEPVWTNLSIGAYNGNIRNGRTGARRLELSIVQDGVTPIDLIRRPDPLVPDPPAVLDQRYFSLASLRIMVSDTAVVITGLPTVTALAPLNLANLAAGGYVVDATHPPVAQAGDPGDGYRIPAGSSVLNGFLKIEVQAPDRSWRDVTLEIVNLGIAGRNPSNGTLDTPDVNTCTAVEPNPNAVLRLQRVKDVPAQFPPCGVQPGTGTVSPAATDYWPNVLYDTREGNLRDNEPQASANLYLGGVVHYLELDVRNLSLWLLGQGPNVMQDTGYVVYFSDRRTNQNGAAGETAEYGFEDFVNPGINDGAPNGVLDVGEDMNGNVGLDVYGQTPVLPGGAQPPLDARARPWTSVPRNVARTNPPVLFRRAIKLVNGQRGNIITPGLTIAAENPVYVQGDYNASTAEGVPATYNSPHAAASVVADATTFLSNAWNDIRSLTSPHRPSNRQASDTTYRVALISGKGISFPRWNGPVPGDFGSDGGVHNFLRYLERWSGRDLNYRGSLISFYFSRQAVGTYKCCSNVYSPPRRNYTFDTDFLSPNLLPPRTPIFRDINSTGYTQIINPIQ